MIKMRGNNSMLASKLHILLNISPHVDWFSWDIYNRDSFDETIEMKGSNSILTSKLHVLLNILFPCWWDSCDEMIKMRGNSPMLTLKAAHFVKYLNSMLMDFHETSITGIFWWDNQNEGNSHMLTSKLYVLLNILSPCWKIFMRLL